MTSEQAAYVAGAIDGEGHIGLMRKAADPAIGRQSAQFTFVMSITNTNRTWLETLASWCGGQIVEVNKASGPTRACYNLRFRSVECRSVLASVMPYLLMKHRQAELVLRYFELAAQRRTAKSPGEKVPQDILDAQEAVHAEIRSLNLHRIKTESSWRSIDAKCSIEDCGRKHYGKGYCWKHYRKYIIRGGPALYERKCESCGRDFVARRSDGACCSKACADKQYYRRNAEIVKAHVAENKRRNKELT